MTETEIAEVKKMIEHCSCYRYWSKSMEDRTTESSRPHCEGCAELRKRTCPARKLLAEAARPEAWLADSGRAAEQAARRDAWAQHAGN